MRALSDARRGKWLGNFLGDLPLASCGIFVGPDRIARWHDVVTDTRIVVVLRVHQTERRSERQSRRARGHLA